jgi:hypothetical protein
MNLPEGELEQRFFPSTPDEDQKDKINQLRRLFLGLAIRIDDYCPPSRETSLALTSLEEAAVWATKSIMKENDHAG